MMYFIFLHIDRQDTKYLIVQQLLNESLLYRKSADDFNISFILIVG